MGDADSRRLVQQPSPARAWRAQLRGGRGPARSRPPDATRRGNARAPVCKFARSWRASVAPGITQVPCAVALRSQRSQAGILPRQLACAPRAGARHTCTWWSDKYARACHRQTTRMGIEACTADSGPPLDAPSSIRDPNRSTGCDENLGYLGLAEIVRSSTISHNASAPTDSMKGAILAGCSLRPWPAAF